MSHTATIRAVALATMFAAGWVGGMYIERRDCDALLNLAVEQDAQRHLKVDCSDVVDACGWVVEQVSESFTRKVCS